MPDGEVRMGGTRRGTRRVTQREAAEILGVSVEAIRKRIKRGTLPSEKGEDGRRYVCLDTAPDAAQPQADHAGHAYAQTEGARLRADAPLVEEMRGRIEDLREQLAAERRANEENRRIIAALTQRIPEIEPPIQETPGPPETATEQPGRVGPQPAVESTQEPREESGMHMPEVGDGAQEGAEPRSWWKRWFGS
jgi:hypothetical protein